MNSYENRSRGTAEKRMVTQLVENRKEFKYCVYCCFPMRSVPSFPVFMFWITGTRLVPPNVKETYCMEAVCSAQLFC